MTLTPSLFHHISTDFFRLSESRRCLFLQVVSFVAVVFTPVVFSVSLSSPVFLYVPGWVYSHHVRSGSCVALFQYAVAGIPAGILYALFSGPGTEPGMLRSFPFLTNLGTSVLALYNIFYIMG
eukprot:RCo000074